MSNRTRGRRGSLCNGMLKKDNKLLQITIDIKCRYGILLTKQNLKYKRFERGNFNEGH